jgi:hypothetical protein
MNQLKKALFLLVVLSSAFITNAWADYNHHGHWENEPGPRGGYWGPSYGPNVIITVPIAPRPHYYRRYCQTVEICNQFDECWLERRCR